MQENDASPSKRRYLIWSLVAAAAMAASAYFFVRGGPGIRPSGPPEKVTIAYSAATNGAVAHVAHMQGYYMKEGLEVTARLHPYGKPALQDLLEGRADFATCGETPVVFAIMKGERVSVVATIETTNQENAIIARRDRGIGALGDLKGRKVATTLGTTMDYFLDATLGAHGIARSEVTVIDLPAEEMPDALARGDVDAISTFHPYIIPAQKKLGVSGITFQDRDIYSATFNIVAKQEFIRQNPGKVKKVLRALIRGEEFVKQNKTEAQKMVADFSGVDVSSVRQSWDVYNFNVSLDQSLLLALEDESKWAIRNRLTDSVKIPNYLDHVYLDGLASVKPKAVKILR